jgi:hypothetical protein
LLEDGLIDPVVLDYVPLESVSQVQQDMEKSQPVKGHFVCEPWLTERQNALFI